MCDVRTVESSSLETFVLINRFGSVLWGLRRGGETSVWCWKNPCSSPQSEGVVDGGGTRVTTTSLV